MRKVEKEIEVSIEGGDKVLVQVMSDGDVIIRGASHIEASFIQPCLGHDAKGQPVDQLRSCEAVLRARVDRFPPHGSQLHICVALKGAHAGILADTTPKIDILPYDSTHIVALAGIGRYVEEYYSVP